MLAMPGASFRREASKVLPGDSVLQAGMYRAAKGAERKNRILVQKIVFRLPRFACRLPIFRQQRWQKIGRVGFTLATFRLAVAGRPDLFWRDTWRVSN